MRVGVAVGAGVNVAVFVAVGVGVSVPVGVAVTVSVAVAVDVAVLVCVAVGAGDSVKDGVDEVDAIGSGATACAATAVGTYAVGISVYRGSCVHADSAPISRATIQTQQVLIREGPFP